MEKLDEGLKTLLDLGKRRGFLTFDQVNDYLPDEASSPEKIHGLLESLDEMGIELINEDEAESRLLASGDLDDEPDDLVDEVVDEEDGELTLEDLDEISRRIDDPVRMYLTQMGEIPLLAREQEISLANSILERVTQVERALERLHEGGYGWCERCGNPIPVERLAAFPSATLCVTCKQLEERR